MNGTVAVMNNPPAIQYQVLFFQQAASIEPASYYQKGGFGRGYTPMKRSELSFGTNLNRQLRRGDLERWTPLKLSVWPGFDGGADESLAARKEQCVEEVMLLIDDLDPECFLTMGL